MAPAVAVVHIIIILSNKLIREVENKPNLVIIIIPKGPSRNLDLLYNLQ